MYYETVQRFTARITETGKACTGTMRKSNKFLETDNSFRLDKEVNVSFPETEIAGAMRLNSIILIVRISETGGANNLKLFRSHNLLGLHQHIYYTADTLRQNRS